MLRTGWKLSDWSCVVLAGALGVVGGDMAAQARGDAPVYRRVEAVEWLADGRGWYQTTVGPGRREIVLVDPGAEEPRRVLGTGEELAEALGMAGRGVEVARLALREGSVGGFDVMLAGGAKASTWIWTPEEGRASVLDAANVPEGFRLEAERRVRRSRNGGRRSGVRFRNRLDRRVTLRWVTGDGARREYGTIDPGEAMWMSTFAGHAWELVDGEGATVAAFVAAERPAIAWIDAEAAPQAVRRRGARRRGSDGRRQTRRAERGEVLVDVRDHNLWSRVMGTAGSERKVTTDGSAAAEFIGPVLWSPDRTRFAVRYVERAEARRVYLVEAAPEDQRQPKLQSFGYRKPGDAIDRPRYRIFSVDGSGDGAVREVEVDRALFETPWALRQPRWSKDGGRFSFVYNQRGHQVARWIGIDAETGVATALIEERCPTFIDYQDKLWLHVTEDEQDAFWMSERSGHCHIYRYSAATGELRNAVTQGDFVVRGVESIDEEAQTMVLRCCGIDDDQDPYHLHWIRVNFDGEVTRLTEGDGTHELSFAPDGSHYVDRWSRVDKPPVVELRRSRDGGLVTTLEVADDSARRTGGWRPPQRFVAKGRDGSTDIWGIVHRPRDHDPARHYPIIESIYAGPHSAHVPKSFRTGYGQQRLADMGFVVVQIDGMGTNHRGKAFHDVAARNLGDAGFPDRIAWIRALAAEDASIDLKRVGIYGGSAGGQNAMRALIAHSDFYKVAVADCGCHDNRMDKIWWNEQWMGWPIDEEAYSASSNVDQAHRMKGALMLIVGALDRNVDPASTMQVVDRLVKADKDFDLVVIPDAGHGAAGTPYGRRRQRDFFREHLLDRPARGGSLGR